MVDIFKPQIAMGTSRSDQVELAAAIKHGLDIGYRIIDTAQSYDNFEAVKEGMLLACQGDPLISRKDIYVISKAGLSTVEMEDFRTECKIALQRIGLDYFDLYLLHVPVAAKQHFSVTKADIRSGKKIELIEGVLKTRWSALEALVDEGLVRAIGVSNFEPNEIEEVLSFCRIPPAVNECEAHPYFSNDNLIKFCKEKKIHFMAYGPLGSRSLRPSIFGGPKEDMNLFKEPILEELSQKHNKTISQILLKWAVGRGTTPIAKSLNPQHLEENLMVSDFQLDEEDMKRIGELSRPDGRIFRYESYNMFGSKA